MRVQSTFVRAAAASTLLLLGSCTNGTFSSPLYLAVSVTPRPATILPGGTVVFTGTVTNDLSLPRWDVLDAADTANAGTLTTISGSPNSILYTAPAAPPIYTGAGAGFTQGTVTVEANVTPPSGSTLPIAHDSVTMFVITPSIAVGISPLTATVALNGGTQLFSGYAVGSVQNAVSWLVNGVVGGAAATGTITATGFYTAPAGMPMTGSTVTITVVSQADPTKTASAAVTLQGP